MKLTLFSVLGFLSFFLGHQYQTTPHLDTKEALGERLFHEKALSIDYSISCASCHIPEFAFADTLPFSKGVNNQISARNTPSCMNMLMRPYFFYDGRAATLEVQVLEPIQNPAEMALPLETAIKRLQNSPYKEHFLHIYKQPINDSLLADALASFIRTLESPGNAPFDVWMNEDIDTAMSQDAIAGRTLFEEKAKCFDCHFSPDMTGDEFKNIGTYNGKQLNDQGRFKISKDSTDLGRFKVPGLRNIALTAPYMHNGMFQTLEEVIDYYDTPNAFIPDAINRDTLMDTPLGLTPLEKKQLLAYLHSLTDQEYQK
jgi:cytochrome c peroxidase